MPKGITMFLFYERLYKERIVDKERMKITKVILICKVLLMLFIKC